MREQGSAIVRRKTNSGHARWRCCIPHAVLARFVFGAPRERAMAEAGLSLTNAHGPIVVPF